MNTVELKQGTDFYNSNTGAKEGIVNYDPNTGAKLGAGATVNYNPSPIPATPSINGTNLGTKPLILSPYVPSTLAGGMEQSFASQNSTMQKAAAQKAKDDQAMEINRQNLETQRSDIATLSEKIGGAGAVQEKAFQAEGGDVAKKEVDRYTSEIEAEQLKTRRRIEELQNNNPQGMLAGGLNGEVDRIQRESTSFQADKAILLNASLRRYDTAAEIADRKKELYLEPLKTRLDTLKFFYQENRADFNKDEERQFNQAVKEADREYNDTKSNLNESTDMLKSAISSGASASVIKKASDLINSGATSLEVAKALGVYADYANALQVKKLRNEINKATTVDPGLDVSSALGSVSGGMGGSILTQTGLSLPAFNFLTQGTAALTRLGADDRKKFMNEAQSFLNKNGVDVATFQSRFKAYNQSLTKNIERFNNTQIAEGEIEGTLDNLGVAADEKDFGNLRVANVAKLFAGEQVNDPATLKYQVHLNQLRSELAFYNAAVQGKTSADLVEFQEAERIIKNGLSSGSLAGFQEALKASVQKMGTVLQGSVDRSSKQVWELFGLGDKYQSQYTKQDAAAATNPFSSSLLNKGSIINTLGEWVIPSGFIGPVR